MILNRVITHIPNTLNTFSGQKINPPEARQAVGGDMIHLGDITKLNGYDIPAVDVICGGSPCQDLSVAGNRAGLEGERSGLFMEQIRIVKEMRNATANDDIRMVKPRFMVWENVPGAFSSNKGKDFQAVLSEIIRIIEPDAPDVPMPEKGKWNKSGCLYDELGRWSIAYRVHDAQFWGVPQRRKRIALVADFGGLSAPEICFERKGLSWDSQEEQSQKEGTAGATKKSIDKAISLQERAGKPGGGKGILIQHERTGTLSMLTNQSVLCLNDQGGSVMDTSEDITATLRAQEHGHQPLVMAMQAIGEYKESKQASALKQRDYKDATDLVVYAEDVRNRTDQCKQSIFIPDVVGALCATDYKGIMNQSIDEDKAIAQGLVRRLTPLECERLQGFPDGWTDIGEWIDSKGKKHKEADSQRYKALGNSIALPFWQWLARRICAQYEHDITMGSLFDGIGGFPLVFERCGAKAVWASEIEEFPMAVTKYHFPEEE